MDQKDDLQAGRTPRVAKDGFTVRDLCNRFLTGKRCQLDAREITPRTFRDYHQTCERIIAAFGKIRLVEDLAADDFQTFRAKLASGWGPVTLFNEINRVRIVFRFAHENLLIKHPVQYGTPFRRPPKRVLRQARQAGESKMFEPAEIRAILAAARPQMKAMACLAVNAG